ncbi:hypothetical protein ARMGADRAFT_176785 [Armillaria gallica]|uniref:DUF6535 domain-containing protein n=1 Tax=Armillaria gallica TaxID=47427 RepID=A0A2H3DSI4_ARMGA|nr:hypothetical protein ARMGADRAFT_176785 [Armillaria gallica]
MLDARVRRTYGDESRIHDANMVDESRDKVDVLLVFAGLFSATVTTICRTSPPYQSMSESLTFELVLVQRAVANGSSVDAFSLPHRVHVLPSCPPPQTSGLPACPEPDGCACRHSRRTVASPLRRPTVWKLNEYHTVVSPVNSNRPVSKSSMSEYHRIPASGSLAGLTVVFYILSAELYRRSYVQELSLSMRRI